MRSSSRRDGLEDRALSTEREVPAASREPDPDTQRAKRDLRRLGKALQERAPRIVERMAELARQAGWQLDSGGQDVAAAAAAATALAAKWLSDGAQAPVDAPARECGILFGSLSRAGVCPLSEATERCLLWRDAVAEAVHEISRELQLRSHARARALVLLRCCLNTAILQVCASFESAHRAAERQLSLADTHDRLTGLPLRSLIVEQIGEMLREVRQPGAFVCVLAVDVDELQVVNDEVGYGAGDELLRQLAGRLRTAAGNGALVGRIGGDEFVVALVRRSEQEAESAAEELLALVRGPYLVARGDDPLSLSASVGCAVGRACPVEQLLWQATSALHQAKLDGRNRAVRFQPGMQPRARTVDIDMQVREAIADRQLELVYQPVFSIATGIEPSGAEALLRWRHPKRGLLSPAEFMPALESSGLIVDVGRFVLLEACAECARWRSEGHELNVGVNVSARQLDDMRIIDDVELALSVSGLDPHALVIEITETAAMRDVHLSMEVLGALKRAGARVAIDDFGTGYSSLAHLQQMPVDTLKIDRAFVSHATVAAAGEVLLRALAQLGSSLQMTTLAEGVETVAQLELLREIGCMKAQGFLLSKPLAADRLSAFLRQGRRALSLDHGAADGARPTLRMEGRLG